MTGSKFSGTVVRARDGKLIQNATVTVDGKAIQLSEGAFATKLTLGDHKVVLEAPGYESVTKQVKVAIFRGVDVGSVGLRNADLKVKTVENYPGYPEIKSASLLVAGRAIDSTASEVTILNLPVGPASLTASASGCQETSMSVSLVAGANSVVCSLTPTLETVAKRSAEHVSDRGLAMIYAVLHPARQRQWGTESEYVKIIEKRDKESAGTVNFVGFKVLTPRKIPVYKDKPSKQTFSNVYAVPIAFRVSSPLLALFGQKEMSITNTDYWVLLDGQWRDLGSGEPVDKK